MRARTILPVSRLSSASRSRIPASPLARIRLLFVVLAVASAIAMVPALLETGRPLPVRLAAALGALGLAAHWVAGCRRGAFPVAGEPLEAAVAFLLLRVTPGDPFLPLFGLVFRCL